MALPTRLHQRRVSTGALQVQGLLEAGSLREELYGQLIVCRGRVVQHRTIVAVAHEHVHRLPAILLLLAEHDKHTHHLDLLLVLLHLILFTGRSGSLNLKDLAPEHQVLEVRNASDAQIIEVEGPVLAQEAAEVSGRASLHNLSQCGLHLCYVLLIASIHFINIIIIIIKANIIYLFYKLIEM